MDYVRNAVSLPDEVLVALSHFLNSNINDSDSEICKETLLRKRYNDSDEPRSIDSYKPRSRSRSIDPQFPMQRDANQEEVGCKCSTNGSANRHNPPSAAQGKLSPSCSKDKDVSGCNPSKCSNDPPFHEEKPPVYSYQDQELRQQLKRSYQQQAQRNRSQHRCSRSRSVPKPNDRHNASERYDFQVPRSLNAGQETTNQQRGCCSDHNQYEGDVPTRNTSNYVPDRRSRSNATDNWNNSSQVGTNYGEWQRRQMQQQQQQSRQQQQQHHQQRQCSYRQQQSNDYDMTALDDNEISGFEPDLNSTMIDEEKRYQKSRKQRPQPPMRKRYASCNNTCSSQSYETPQIPRRAAQCDSSQIERQQLQRQCSPMYRKKPQKYETIINETSYLDLPEVPCRPNINKRQCPNSQAKCHENSSINPPCQVSQRSRSLSPLKYKSRCTTRCANNTNMDMEENDFYPEDTNCCRSPPYTNVSGAMLARSSMNETRLDKTNQNSDWEGRSGKMYSNKTPEDYLAERTQAEFMDALVKDRTSPGAIQATLNGNENFNEFAFDIAFPGSIPAKPFPVDPITMLEAIKLRIDYERERIRRIHRPITTEDIESHFSEKNKTEVNESVAAFLKAESEYQETMPPETFEAEINGIDTNMFDDNIKLNVYTATTQPGQEVLDLSYR
ncbi:uncharacterized protein LOC110185178 [Drosophila serrata]|uniref:uncharacterized protein LOC110185178 n=1 Tax=Drosophila serrata TaxID=7274 RepID=UPI000A1D343E|nr:uncharacterized protein LOC110185178 [Drosophila serrata]